MIDAIKRLFKRYFLDNIYINRFFKLFSIDILVKISAFLLLPVYLKLMTQEEYGLFGYLFSIVITLSGIMQFGMYIPQSKLYFDYDAEEKKSLLFTINMLLITFLTVVLGSAYFLKLDYRVIRFMFSKEIPYQNYREVIFIGIFVSAYINMFYNFLLTSERIKSAQAYNVVRLIVVNALTLAFLFFTTGNKAMIRLSSNFYIELLILMGFGIIYIKSMKPRFNFIYMKKALLLALPVTLSTLVGALNISDRFFIEKFGGLKNMAVFNLSATIAGVIGLISGSIQNTWLPLFFKEKNFDNNLRRTKKAAIIIMLVLALIGVGLVAMTKVILMFKIIDQKYANALFILPFLLLGQIFNAVTPLFSNYAIYIEKTYLSTIISFIYSLVFLAANFILVPIFNVFGAALSLPISGLVCLSIYFILIKFYIARKYKSKS